MWVSWQIKPVFLFEYFRRRDHWKGKQYMNWLYIVIVNVQRPCLPLGQWVVEIFKVGINRRVRYVAGIFFWLDSLEVPVYMALILLFVETSNSNCVQVFPYLFRFWINSPMARYKESTNTRRKQTNYIKIGINQSVMMMIIIITLVECKKQRWYQ